MALPERRPRPLGPLLTASLALHLTVLMLLLLGLRHPTPRSQQVPPADYAMVFEGHSPTRNSGPNPQRPNATQPGSPAPTPARPPVPEVPGAPPSVSALPPLPPPPPPEPTQVSPTPPTVAALPLPPSPVPPIPTEPSRPPAVPVPPPPPPLAMAIPQPPKLTTPTPPRRRVETPETKPAPAFPTPLAFSFGGSGPTLSNPLPATQPTRHIAPASVPRAGQPGTIDLSFGPIAGGSLAPSASVQMEGVSVSTDWLNLVSAWWQRHSYYPPQAAMNGDDGDVTLHMRVDHDGHVSHLELVQHSGSQWLDMAALSIFRDAYLPPLPNDMPEAQIPFHVTIHFVLIR